MGQYVIYNGNRFVLKAENNEVILTSEGYGSKQACLNGIESVKRNSPYDDHYDRKMSSNGQYYFNLKAVNSEIIGTSEMYISMYGRENGIISVKRNGPTSSISEE